MTDTTDHDAYDDAAELCGALADQEWRVLTLLHSHRRLADRIVAAAGLAVRHFASEDHRLIFAGWLLACEHDLPKERTARLTLQSLREIGSVIGDVKLAGLFFGRFTVEELNEVVGRGPSDGLRRSIARHVVALIQASEAIGMEAQA